MGEFGVAKRKFAPTVFGGVERGIRCVITGDDVTFLGWQRDLDGAVDSLNRHYELKVCGVLGGDGRGEGDIVTLNCTLFWRGERDVP